MCGEILGDANVHKGYVRRVEETIFFFFFVKTNFKTFSYGFNSTCIIHCIQKKNLCIIHNFDWEKKIFELHYILLFSAKSQYKLGLITT